MSILIEILKIPGFIIGVITMLGLIMLKKPINKILYGTLKTILGFFILTLGVEIISKGFQSFETLFIQAFQIQGIYLDDNIVIGTMMSDKGDTIGIIMVIGFLFHLLIARFTPMKLIYLTGHKIWHLSGAIILAFYSVNIHGLRLIIYGSIILGIFMSLQPFILQPWIEKITGNNKFGMGHTISLLVIFASIVGKYLGSSQPKIEYDQNFNYKKIIEELSISLTFIIFIMFLLPVFILDTPTLNEIAKNNNPIVYVIGESLKVASGMIIVLKGVEMFLKELIPAFEGIAKKIVPNAKPALDVPVFFSYAPQGVSIGLIASFIGWVLSTYVCRLLQLPIIPVPSMMGIMFGGTILGVFGFCTGAKRGAIMASFLGGFFWPVFVSFLFPLINLQDYGAASMGILTPDLYIIAVIVRFITRFI
ncbi:hypothetical protein LJ207_10645 [Halanaerobium sp. Z-7514]|uniref:Ascorbate-specific PTS system EIIC component n=1 Tax=Halanaerobium polyolivorans TaxID=2886943 RepID=A0AAW4X1Y5_9FIRM|nr:PTS transporter subunit IIC [Halanaerobium polyolivorans]MCC3145782.1 hypothetical protein [Halanaerobium polyolivorans]